jgi:hypothetical protein
MLERALEEQSLEVRRRLYAHHDYFGNIIPSSWFVLGTLISAFIFYRPQLTTIALELRDFVRQLGEPTTGVDVVLAILLAIVLFNVIYIIGQLLNGVAAVVLDRLIVKKLLQYPFTLYELKWKNRSTPSADTAMFRQSVLTATYAVFCVNLAPVFFFELALIAFGRENPHAGSWVQRHPAPTLLLSALLVLVHFGIPSFRKAKEVSGSSGDPGSVRLELTFGHMALVVIATFLVGMAIIAIGFTEIVLLLPISNVVVAIADRHLLSKYGVTYKTAGMRAFFIYVRRTFVNPAYFAAKLVGYGSAPAAELIGRAFTEAKYDSTSNDFYWMCQLTIENDAPRTYDTAYHGMAMYTMNRNLCNATAFVVIVSLVAFYAHWPDGYRYVPLLWVAVLCAVTYAFFIRYLYLFSGLYSKYIVRAAAFLADRKPATVVLPNGA